MISVIVPVFNAEKYIENCILSILNQTYPHFELILIDDGSMDQSMSICKKFEIKDQRVNQEKQVHVVNGKPKFYEPAELKAARAKLEAGAVYGSQETRFNLSNT